MVHLPRQLPPAGTPLGLADVLRSSGGLVDAEAARHRLSILIRRETGARHCLLAGSGRSILWLLLEAMKEVAGGGRSTVLLSAHTCASLPSAIIRAGLTPIPLPLDEATLDYHQPSLVAALARHRPLALLAVNLFGMPGRSSRWAELAKEAGAYFIDDAAQTLGTGCGGRLSGRWGDAGFFSLARGKNITAMGGGILVTDRDDLAAAVRDQTLHHLAAPSAKRGWRTLVEAAAFTVLLHPRRYWLVPHLPGVRLQVFELETGFPVRQMSGVQADLACRSWRRLDEANHTRRRNGGRLIAVQAYSGCR